MYFSLSRIKVTDLFGRHSFDVRISDNRGILIAPNGSGKSNILQLVTFALGRQWDRVLDISFSTLVLEINNTPFRIDRSKIAHRLYDVPSFSQEIGKFISQSGLDVIYTLAANGILSQLSRLDRVFLYGQTPQNIIDAAQVALGCHPKTAEYILESLKRNRHSQLLRTEQVISNGNLLDKILEGSRIVYLPTYRRIEKDIRFLFNPSIREGLGPDIATVPQGKDSGFFLELVDFGMNDVSVILSETERSQSMFALSTAYSLSGQYLGDVVSETAQQFDREKIASLNDERISSMVARVRHQFTDQHSLADRIKNVVERIRFDKAPRANDRYIAHYIQLLIDAEETIRQNESNVSRFVFLCNRYLTDKVLTYDSFRSEFALFAFGGSKSATKIPLSFLSSGEKQIVSLFCHLCFGNDNTLFFIDEPELSLSIDWQQRLLVDIWETRKCKFLFATTHSPFVYENEFIRHSVDLLAMRTIEAA